MKSVPLDFQSYLGYPFYWVPFISSLRYSGYVFVYHLSIEFLLLEGKQQILLNFLSSIVLSMEPGAVPDVNKLGNT